MTTIIHASFGPNELSVDCLPALREAGVDVAIYQYAAPADATADGFGTILVRFGAHGWDLFSLDHGPQSSPIAMVARHPDRELMPSLDLLESMNHQPGTRHLCANARAMGFR